MKTTTTTTRLCYNGGCGENKKISGTDADFVTEFNRKKKTIHNRTFASRFPPAVIRKVHSNLINMKDSLDMVNADMQLIPRFEKTLRSLGFESMNGSSSTKIDMAKITGRPKKVWKI